jgi:hypothetical protein
VESGSWGPMMASYRVYSLDGAGHIGLADWFEAEDDSAALAFAQELNAGALKCELWLDNRMIGTFSRDDMGRNHLTAPSREARAARH